MGITDLRTKRYISDLLGRRTRREKVDGSHWTMRLLGFVLGFATVKARFQNVERLLMDPERVGDHTTPSHGMMIVTGKDRPYTAAIEPYWKSLPVWRYALDPSYGETIFRRFTRWIIGSIKTRRRNAATLHEAKAEV